MMDTANTYASVVEIPLIIASKLGTGRGSCTGVLVHPYLVLTAGHCVCMRHEGVDANSQSLVVVDKSMCRDKLQINTVFYNSNREPPHEGADGFPKLLILKGQYLGHVVPHPELSIVYASIDPTDSTVLSNHADLAAIHLEEPVLYADKSQTLKTRIKPIQLASKRVELFDGVLMVGLGKPTDGQPPGNRFYARNKVKAREEGGGKVFRVGENVQLPTTFKRGEPFARVSSPTVRPGDSGSPCLRETGDKVELVGIASEWFIDENSGLEFSDYTDVFFYKDWIEGELKEAEGFARTRKLSAPD